MFQLLINKINLFLNLLLENPFNEEELKLSLNVINDWNIFSEIKNSKNPWDEAVL